MRPVLKGSTDQSVIIRIVDSVTGLPETGVEHNTGGIDLWYRREGATKTSITEAALTALNDAHSDGGIEHIGDGYYRLDLPDAAFATGANGVAVGGTVTDMVVIGCYVPLVDFNPYDGVRLGLTALPNAAADAAGGLPISDAGGLDLDAKLATATSALGTAAELAKVPKSDSNVTWNATALASINTQADLALSDYDPPTKAELDTAIDALPTAAEVTTAVLTTAMTEAYRSAGAAGTLAQYVHEIIAHLGEFTISGTTKTSKKLDGSTTAKTYTLNDATSPTGITEAT